MHGCLVRCLPCNARSSSCAGASNRCVVRDPHLCGRRLWM
jgi:hypothetical protein